MKICIRSVQSNDLIDIDFICEASVPATNLYLLILNLNTYRYCGNPFLGDERKTPSFSSYQLVCLQHVMYGYFYLNEKKINCQVVGYVKNLTFAKFETVLLPIMIDDKMFQSPHMSESLAMDDVSYCLVDLDDYNRTRKLLDLSEYSLKEYIARKVVPWDSDEYGLTLDDEVSLFSNTTGKVDTSNLMTIKGLRMFIEHYDEKKA